MEPVYEADSVLFISFFNKHRYITMFRSFFFQIIRLKTLKIRRYPRYSYLYYTWCILQFPRTIIRL
jgi:hypothetical protein